MNAAPGRRDGGPLRRVFRLDAADGPATWREATAAEVAALEELERKESSDATRDIRKRARAESKAIRSAGFLIAETDDGWTYRDRDLVLAERRAGSADADDRWLDVHVPREEAAGRVILRPWRMWIADDEYWRPEYDAALTPARRRKICARLRAWLVKRNVGVRLITALPSPASPVTIERVSFAALRSILEFLLASGSRLAGGKPRNRNYPGSGDPMEVFRGRGAPRKWYATKGGEQNVHLQGPIPVDRVLGAFRLPNRPRNQAIGAVSVSARAIEASGGDLWEGFIWGGPRRR